MTNNQKRLALTCGDQEGIGPEITAHWLGKNPAEAETCAVIGPKAWGEKLVASHPALRAVAVGENEPAVVAGQPSLSSARVALAAMQRAAEGVKAGEFSGVVSGPVSKSWLQKVGFTFPGQTEFFAHVWDGEPTMAFCGGRLRVVLATWHIPLRAVAAALTPEVMRRAVESAVVLTGKTAPRIGVCGLNPHAGEDGLLGTEERDTLDPMRGELRKTFPGLSRCLPGDTVFVRALRGEFDVVIALYHDQGLAPLKVLEFDEAVNVTLGLPFVRTSPDHGTAFEIAGKGIASFSSFARAVDVARELIARRA